ncbi:MAG TPA: hypothetical protein ENK99_07315 [Campylobacterales bacterium]|nr:hypothetical protein [Campylobacterales bacterium]
MKKYFQTEIEKQEDSISLETYLAYGTKKHTNKDRQTQRFAKENNFDTKVVTDKILNTFFNKSNISKKQRLDYISKVNTKDILKNLLEEQNV